MIKETNIIQPTDICEIGQILEIGTGLFLRIEHFLPGSPGLVRGAILIQGRDILLGADLLAGLILETGILVMVRETTAIDHHLVRGVGTALEINKGTVLLPTHSKNSGPILAPKAQDTHLGATGHTNSIHAKKLGTV